MVEDRALNEMPDPPHPDPLHAGEREQLFGHPRGLTFLFTTEMWERFSYYGMRSLLVLYMTKFLLLEDHSGNVIGLAGLKRALEGVFGPLDVQPLSSQIWGLYTGLVYFTPIFGGLLADRVLGQRRTVVIGAVLMAFGHFMMASEQLFLFALLALILGSGCFKPNISTQVGGLYAPGDPRRDRAYSIFYVGINLGAFLAPLVCGTLGEGVGWHYGFAAAGVGMVIGLCIYLYALPLLPTDEMHRAQTLVQAQFPLPGVPATLASRGAPNPPPLAGEGRVGAERRAVFALLALFVPNTLFWAAYEQMGNTIILWADAYTDRSLDPLHLFGSGAQIPTTWFLAVNPFMIFAFTPFVVALWARQAARGTEPPTITKMALGCFGVAAAYLIMVAAALHAGTSGHGGATGAAGKASWLWLFAYFVIITLGELYLSPVGLSFVTKVAPARLISLMMGVWLATSFTGGFLSGYIGSFWSRMAKPEFFLLVAGVAALAGVMIWGCRWVVKGAESQQ
ncbi:MAG TPA: peptide MFS transporter [Xanthobacteraceae bacterium]|nr:peptide MFS transporter [Xanthobacteraceae bacterium]